MLYAKKQSRRSRGSAVLEMALTGWLLCMVCYGTVEFGYFFFVKNMMQAATREGCRAGITDSGNSNTNITQAVVNELAAAGLVASGTTAPSSFPATIGNYTVNIYDLTSDSSMASPLSGISTVTVGDTLGVKITLTWGNISPAFRPMSLIGGSSGTKTVTATCAMRRES